MASPSTEAPRLPSTTIRDLIVHGEYDDDDDDDFIAEEEEDEWDDVARRVSRLSVEGSDGGDADDENDNEEDEEDDAVFDEVSSDVNGATYRLPVAPPSASLPGTPARAAQSSSQSPSSPWWPGPSGGKEYASETELGSGGARHRHHHHRHGRRARMTREVWLERAWRLRKQRRELTPPPSRGAVDLEEARACRDLGLDLPGDWTVEVEVPGCYAVDTASSGANSPASGGSWRISSPGDDPKDVKARLKVWAQAVALASASRLGS